MVKNIKKHAYMGMLCAALASARTHAMAVDPKQVFLDNLQLAIANNAASAQSIQTALNQLEAKVAALRKRSLQREDLGHALLGDFTIVNQELYAIDRGLKTLFLQNNAFFEKLHADLPTSELYRTLQVLEQVLTPTEAGTQ